MIVQFSDPYVQNRVRARVLATKQVSAYRDLPPIWQDPGEIALVRPELSQKEYLVDQLLYLLDLMLSLLLVGIASRGYNLPELASGDQ